MIMQRILLVAALCVLVTGCKPAAEPAKVDTDGVASAVMTRAQAKAEKNEWGDFYAYHSGKTYGTEDMLSGVAEIKPGQEIHPPHVHSEEEFLMVVEGAGIWHLNGKDFPASAGDMLYSRPWEIHGIKNTGTTTLKFVFWKWNSKGVPKLPDPAKK
jgi:mannose-6-phosphate isomerase-like protein (cupin superfamily)